MTLAFFQFLLRKMIQCYDAPVINCDFQEITDNKDPKVHKVQ
jgi:hypothetical protein